MDATDDEYLSAQECESTCGAIEDENSSKKRLEEFGGEGNEANAVTVGSYDSSVSAASEGADGLSRSLGDRDGGTSSLPYTYAAARSRGRRRRSSSDIDDNSEESNERRCQVVGAENSGVRADVSVLDLHPDQCDDPPLEERLGRAFQEGGTFEEYRQLHSFSVKYPEYFWTRLAMELYVTGGSPAPWDVEAFHSEDKHHMVKFMPGAKTNACVNLIDHNISKGFGERPALHYAKCVGTLNIEVKTYTYSDLKREVCRCSHVLQKIGVRAGQRVVIFLPDRPELVYFILACFRVGAVVVPVYNGASMSILKHNIEISECTAIVTANVVVAGKRNLKNLCDEAAAADQPFLKAIIVLDAVGDKAGTMTAERDYWYSDIVADVPDDHEPVMVDAEDPIFWARSSGTSGEPRMFEHRTLGFLVYMRAVFKYFLNFNVEERGDTQDVCLCLASPAWIYGLQAMLLGPLLNRGATVLFDGPKEADIIKTVIHRCRVTHLCSVPEFLLEFSKNLSARRTRRQVESLRLVSAAGSPFTVKAYDCVVGHFQSRDRSDGKRLADLWGQTEAGSYLFSSPPTSFGLKKSKNMLPFYGIDALVADEYGREMNATKCSAGELVVSQPWPCVFRRIIGNDGDKHLQALIRDGLFFTGDRANRYPDGSFEFLGRGDNCHKVGDKDGVIQRLVQMEAVEEAIESYGGLEEEFIIKAYAAPWVTKEGYGAHGLLAVIQLNEETVPTGLSRELAQKLGRHATEILGVEVPVVACVVQSRKRHMVEHRSGKKHRQKLRSAGLAGCLEDSLGTEDKITKKQMDHLENVLQEKNLKAVRLYCLKSVK